MSAKKRRLESRDPEVLLQWFDEVSSGEEEDTFTEDSDEDQEDNVQVSDHDSDSELEASESEQSEHENHPNTGNEDATNANFYVGKDKRTKWKKNRPNTKVRTRAHNIILHLPGPKGEARNSKSEIECLSLFINNNVIQIITTSTNIYIEKIRNQFTRLRDARFTDEREIRAYIGLLLLIGSLRSSRKNAAQLWDNSKGSGIEACYLSMSLNRFRFLTRCLRFDDFRDREDRKSIDKLAPIRELFENFNALFQKNFTAAEYLTIDEQLLAFRGRCSFKQYIPSKPAKYGVKVFSLVDSKTAYTLNLEVYVGTQPEGPFRHENSAEAIVRRLVTPVRGTNRNITGDNWFSSISLAKKLLREEKLTYLGTLRKNKCEVPPQFLPNKTREEKSTLFGFEEDCTLASYVPKKNRAVLLISTMHHDDAIDQETGDDKKPEMITQYNKTKIGVDLVDQLCQKYNVARNTRRWPMVLFYDLINISGINALAIYRLNNVNTTIKRRTFIENCAWELIKDQIVHRSTLNMLPVSMRRRAKDLLGISDEQEWPPQIVNNVVRRCSICPRNKDKSTRKICNKCNKFMCKEHCREICVSCLANK